MNEEEEDDESDTENLFLRSLFGSTSKNAGHKHKVEVSPNGFGVAMLAGGHTHEINNFIVLDKDGHNHTLSQISLTENQNSKENKMKSELVDGLIANCECWTEDDKETLNKFTEKKLKALNKSVKDSKENNEKLKEQEEVINIARKGFSTEAAEYVLNEKNEWEETKKDKLKNDPTSNEKTKIKTEDLPEDVQNRLNYLETLETDKKQEVVNFIVANVKDDTEKATKVENLMKKPLVELQEIVSYLPERKQELDKLAANYSGSFIPSSVHNTPKGPAGGSLGLPEPYLAESK